MEMFKKYVNSYLIFQIIVQLVSIDAKLKLICVVHFKWVLLIHIDRKILRYITVI